MWPSTDAQPVAPRDGDGDVDADRNVLSVGARVSIDRDGVVMERDRQIVRRQRGRAARCLELGERAEWQIDAREEGRGQRRQRRIDQVRQERRIAAPLRLQAFVCNSCSYIDLSDVTVAGDAETSSASSGEKKGSGGTKPDQGVQPPRLALIWRPLLTPPVDAYQRFGAQRDEASYVLPLGAGLYAAAGGTNDCNGDIVNERLGAHLLARLADTSLVWANAAEPYSHQGADIDFPLAVVLSADGEDLVDTIATDGKNLLADNDRSIVRPPRIGSPHAHGYVPVLSRMRRGVFVVGGQDVATGVPTGEIWFNPLDDPRWNLVPAGYSPEHVLAATYLYSTDELVVLDETSDGMARLMAIELRRKSLRLLGTWARNPAWNRHWLVADRDGSLLLASASTHDHAIARVELRARSVELVGIASGHRPLVLPPLVDGGGYTLVLAQSQGNGKVKIERTAELALVSATLADLGQQL
jgi:hypothetical protein